MNPSLSCTAKHSNLYEAVEVKHACFLSPNNENEVNGINRQSQYTPKPKTTTHFAIVIDMLNQDNQAVYREQNIHFITESSKKFYGFYSGLSDKPYRRAAVEWMVKVTRKLNGKETTLYLACYYFDRFIAANGDATLGESEVQKLALACLYLSTRFNERTPLSISAILVLGDDIFTKEEIIEMHDQLISKTLNFDLGVPTIFELYILFAVKIGMTEREFFMGLFLVECALLDVTLLPDIRLLALAVVYLVIVIDKKGEAQFAPLRKLADIKSRKFQMTLLGVSSNAESVLNSEITSIKEKYAAVF